MAGGSALAAAGPPFGFEKPRGGALAGAAARTADREAVGAGAAATRTRDDDDGGASTRTDAGAAAEGVTVADERDCTASVPVIAATATKATAAIDHATVRPRPWTVGRVRDSAAPVERAPPDEAGTDAAGATARG